MFLHLTMVRHFIMVHIFGVTCTNLCVLYTKRLLVKASSGAVAVYGGGRLSRWWWASRQPLPPNSLLSRVHFGFSQGRPVPGNFYNAPPVHCSALRLTALQFAPPLYWQTPTWLRHTTNAISPPHDATLCYFHAVLCYVGNTISPPLEYL